MKRILLAIIMVASLLSFSQSRIDVENDCDRRTFGRFRINIGASLLNNSKAFEAKILEVTGSSLPKSALSASLGVDFGLPKNFELGISLGMGRADNRFTNAANAVVMNLYEGAVICRYDGILKKSNFRIEPFVGIGVGYNRLLVNNKEGYDNLGDIWNGSKSINLIQEAVFTGNVGFDIGYRFANKTMLSLQFTYKQPFNSGNFKPDYRNSQVIGGLPSAGLFRMGISVGVTWMLFGKNKH